MFPPPNQRTKLGFKCINQINPETKILHLKTHKMEVKTPIFKHREIAQVFMQGLMEIKSTPECYWIINSIGTGLLLSRHPSFSPNVEPPQVLIDGV